MDTHKGLMEDILKKLPPLENSLVAWAVLMPEQWGSRPVHIYWDKDVAQRKADSFFDDSQTMQDAITFNICLNITILKNEDTAAVFTIDVV